MHITIVTPTGHRPAVIQLLKKYIEAQTYKDEITWVIVNDGVPDDVPFNEVQGVELISIAATTTWHSGYNTQRLNWMDALKVIPKDTSAIFCMEDDDYYSPEYLETYVKLLDTFSLVGEGNNKYYYVPGKCFKEMNNYVHTSLSSLAFRSGMLSTFLEALHSGEVFFDTVLWDLVRKQRISSLLFTNHNLSIGIKGLPGRPGIGVGHTPEKYESDPFFTKLDEWCKESANNYMEFIPKKMQRKV